MFSKSYAGSEFLIAKINISIADTYILKNKDVFAC